MGSLFRSEKVTLCQLFLQSEAAYNCVSELGEIGLVQFRDLNPDVNAFQRKFVNEVRRCDEMERKLRFLEKEIKKDEIPMLDTGDNPEAPQPREMIDLEATFEKLENEMKEVNANAEALKRNFLELTELKHILRKTQVFFEEAEYYTQAASNGPMTEESVNLLSDEGLTQGGQQALRLGFVAGVILRERIPAFERMLWRACRGNVFLRRAEIEIPLEDPVTGDQVNKSVFIIFFQGEQLKQRVKKICEGFRATLYPCPETQAERREMAIGVMTRIEDLNTVLSQTQDHRHRVLVAAAKNIKVWFNKVRKIKAIYHTLNMFNLDVTQKCLISECWCPVDDLDRIQAALRRGTERSGSSVPSILNRMTTKQEPPTYNKTNKLTGAFQGLIDAYGVATYREVNPAPFAIITFPFLFAIMFGDTGHGIIMFLFGLWMVVKEKSLGASKSDNEIWNTFFGGRYLIMMMGLFSIYTGLIYNDIFSKSMNIFGSSWNADIAYPGDMGNNVEKLMLAKTYRLNPNSTNWSKEPYPFGMDPAWQFATNKLMYVNSFKMKMSVTIGVMQMMFGVILSLFNHVHFGNYLNIYAEFIPQIIFLAFIFLYLVVIIIAKWIYFDPITMNTNCAPALLIGFINMFMFNYPNKDASPTPPCSSLTWYDGQQVIQTLLVVCALICAPWMLLVKPIILRQRSRQVKTAISVNSGDIRNQISENVEVVHHDETVLIVDEEVEKFEFGDIFIHQVIHTIEYCLGCISNTASYLRLWALSLAHAELSEVLWNMVFRIGLGIDGWLGAIMVPVVFAPWACLTIAILLLMEGLSAFLHTLRLHWVEFDNKFYSGSGYLFTPFSFDDIMDVPSGLGDD